MVHQILEPILLSSYEFIYKWGYLALFLFSFLENATFSLFPIPTMFFVFTFGKILNPFVLGILCGVGSTLGSLSAYTFGRGFKDLVEKKYSKQLEATRKKFEKYDGGLWIAITNIIPMPSGILALFCGVIRYDLQKYLTIVLISKIIVNLAVAYAGFYSVSWLSDLLGVHLPALT